MTIKTFKKLFQNLLIVNGGKKVEVELRESNRLEPLEKYIDIAHFMVDETFDNLKVDKERAAFFYTNTHHIEIYVK